MDGFHGALPYSGYLNQYNIHTHKEAAKSDGGGFLNLSKGAVTVTSNHCPLRGMRKAQRHGAYSFLLSVFVSPWFKGVNLQTLLYFEKAPAKWIRVIVFRFSKCYDESDDGSLTRR